MWCYCTLNSKRNQLTGKANKILTLSIRQSKSTGYKFRDPNLKNWEHSLLRILRKSHHTIQETVLKNIWKLSNKEYTNESWEVWNWKLVYDCGGAWQRNKENDGKKASKNCWFWDTFWVLKLKNFRTPTFKNFKKKTWYHSRKWFPENFGKFLTNHVEMKVDECGTQNLYFLWWCIS